MTYSKAMHSEKLNYFLYYIELMCKCELLLFNRSFYIHSSPLINIKLSAYLEVFSNETIFNCKNCSVIIYNEKSDDQSETDFMVKIQEVSDGRVPRPRG